MFKKSVRILAAVAMLVVILAGIFGCGGGTAVTTTVTQTPESGQGGDVIYSDDFSDPNSGWDVYDDYRGWIKYEGGWLHLMNYTETSEETSSDCNRYFTDFILEVDTKLVAGTDDNWHSIGCRLTEDGSYYKFSISADGYYRVSVWIEDIDIDQSNGPQSSAYINQGIGAVNRMRIECIGDRLRLYANGHLLREMTDDRLTGGDIYFAVSSLAGDYSEVAFDNLVITEP
jgi:hypothetical protein